MLEAHEAKIKVADDDLEMMTDHDDEELKEDRKGEEEDHVKIVKQMTMEVTTFEVFTNSLEYKNDNIANFVLAVS